MSTPGNCLKTTRPFLAFEVCNEPHYSPPNAPVTAFANRLAQAIRTTGCRQPVFYNLAESPAVKDAILDAQVDGFTLQWYPAGLVAGHGLRGNLLPYVDSYPLPYQEDPRFQRKARLVYEFESADIIQPVMYPFMARSLRTAGFQWATQFASGFAALLAGLAPARPGPAHLSRRPPRPAHRLELLRRRALGGAHRGGRRAAAPLPGRNR